MARIVSSTFGELRGSVGGNTFSRNRAGMYVRFRAIPTNPDTVAQQQARSAFAGASQAWCALNSAEKSSYTEFAINPSRFQPLLKMNTGQMNGQNAYTAMQSLASIMNRRSPGYTDIDVEYIDYTNTYTPATIDKLYGVTVPGTAPDYGVKNVIPVTGGSTAPLFVDNIALNKVTGELVFEVRTQVSATNETSSAVGWTNPPFVDDFGTRFGFAVYASEPMKSNLVKANKPHFNCLSYIKPIDMTTSSTGIIGAKLTVTTDVVDNNDYKYQLNGEALLITVYAVGENGTATRIGSQTVSI